MEFAYSNNFHTSIGATPFEVLYRKSSRTLFCWNELGERAILGPKLVDDIIRKIKVMKRNLKVAQDQHKDIAYRHAKGRK